VFEGVTCLVYKVPSIIGGGSFVQQRGQTVVGLSLSPIFLCHEMREKEKKENGKKEERSRGLERPSVDCVVCMMMMMDHVQFPIQANISYT